MRTSYFGIIAVCFISMSMPLHAEDKWAGAYAGISAGGVFGDVSVRDNPNDGVPPGPFDYDLSGGLAGGTVGYNWTNGDMVFGVEGDIGYASLDASGKILSENSPEHWQDLTLSNGMLLDLTGRIGLSMGNVLFYGKGGVALYTGSAMQDTTKPEYYSEGTGTFTGWTAGVGAEAFVAENISVKAEYQYYDFGEQQAFQQAMTIDPPDTIMGAKFLNWHDVNFGTVKVGINFHMN